MATSAPSSSPYAAFIGHRAAVAGAPGAHMARTCGVGDRIHRIPALPAGRRSAADRLAAARAQRPRVHPARDRSRGVRRRLRSMRRRRWRFRWSRTRSGNRRSIWRSDLPRSFTPMAIRSASRCTTASAECACCRRARDVTSCARLRASSKRRIRRARSTRASRRIGSQPADRDHHGSARRRGRVAARGERARRCRR